MLKKENAEKGGNPLSEALRGLYDKAALEVLLGRADKHRYAVTVKLEKVEIRLEELEDGGKEE